MPGLLSSIFDDNGKDDAYSSSSQTHEAGGDAELDLAPEITVSSHMSGSYETDDGTTHSWERTDTVTLHADTHVSAAVDAVLTIEDEAF